MKMLHQIYWILSTVYRRNGKLFQNKESKHKYKSNSNIQNSKPMPFKVYKSMYLPLYITNHTPESTLLFVDSLISKMINSRKKEYPSPCFKNGCSF